MEKAVTGDHDARLDDLLHKLTKDRHRPGVHGDASDVMSFVHGRHLLLSHPCAKILKAGAFDCFAQDGCEHALSDICSRASQQLISSPLRRHSMRASQAIAMTRELHERLFTPCRPAGQSGQRACDTIARRQRSIIVTCVKPFTGKTVLQSMLLGGAWLWPVNTLPWRGTRIVSGLPWSRHVVTQTGSPWWSLS